MSNSVDERAEGALSSADEGSVLSAVLKHISSLEWCHRVKSKKKRFSRGKSRVVLAKADNTGLLDGSRS